MRPGTDLIGQLVADKYELLRGLGYGGMGDVYEARNIATLKRCAVKLLTPELASDEEMVKRFFREARASGLIENEHVVAAYDSGIDTAGRAYYVMDCLQGEDLNQTLKRVGSLNPTAAAKIVLQAAHGLASAHLLGIVHRDVKPANLFLAVSADDEVKVKILDFGIAKVKMEMLQESAHTLTRAGIMLGTPTYMSPEQVKRASSIDESTDVWSLGIVLFECISGSPPWGNVESIGELLAAVLTLDLPMLQDCAPWVQPGIAHVVHRALSRDLNYRMRRASELRDTLRKLIDGDVRLYRHELTPVSEEERSKAAERLSLADTMTMLPGQHSGRPVVTSVMPLKPERSRKLATIGGGVAAIGIVASAAVWMGGHRVAEQHGVGVALPLSASATGVASASAALVPSVVPRSIKSFNLQVWPWDGDLSVDGVSTPIRNGQVLIEGEVGARRNVMLKRGNQHEEITIVITENGTIPTIIALAPSGSVVRSIASSSAPDSKKTPDGGLSVTFE